ncbi:MAG: S41 family peptidase [Armatimonadetes bacterium]|nr:S41 family peptidase [Armatimonadota bacterium]
MNGLVKFLIVGAATCASFALGFGWKDIKSGQPPKSPVQTAAKSEIAPTQLVMEEYRRILNLYGGEVDSNQLMYSGLSGMVSALGDPYTQFFEPYVAQQFEKITMGTESFGGIGARLAPDPLGVKVIQVFKGGPAERGGITGGDIIIGVNTETVSGMASDDIVGKIKGKIGTSVSLKILRGGKQTLNFQLKRGRIEPPSADGNILEGSNIGYLMVTGFTSKTPREFYESIDRLENQGIEGLIIDLRDNGGGLLESAQMMLARFYEFKTVVTMRERGGFEEVVKTPGGYLHPFNYPVVVLTNEQSASASEIFAGGLRDYKKATLVGTTTFGKASVQNVHQLGDRTQVKVTIAKYYLPSGEFIGRKEDEDGVRISGGIKPDVEVKMSLRPNVAIGDPKTDNQLQEAMKVIRLKNPSAK